MVYPTLILLVLCLFRENTYWTLFVIGSIYKTSCDDICQNMRKGYIISSYFVWWGCPSWDCMMHPQHIFFSTPPPGGLFPYFTCFLFLSATSSSLKYFCVDHSLLLLYWPFTPQSLQVAWSRFFSFCLILFFSPSWYPVFPRSANISWVLTTSDWYFLLLL